MTDMFVTVIIAVAWLAMVKRDDDRYTVYHEAPDETDQINRTVLGDTISVNNTGADGGTIFTRKETRFDISLDPDELYAITP